MSSINKYDSKVSNNPPKNIEERGYYINRDSMISVILFL